MGGGRVRTGGIRPRRQRSASRRQCATLLNAFQLIVGAEGGEPPGIASCFFQDAGQKVLLDHGFDDGLEAFTQLERSQNEPKVFLLALVEGLVHAEIVNYGIGPNL